MSALAPYHFAGGTAVVTGAASGIGEQLALALAARGSDLVLLDRNAEGLARVAATIRAGHPQRSVTELVVDLADPTAVDAAAAQILTEHPRLTLLVNNAGVALAGRFQQVSLEEFEWVMAINFRAPVRLTHQLLPALCASPGSHVVNVSSLFGLMTPVGQSAYSASKFALRGFSEVLRAELSNDGVGVTTVYPGGIRTRIAANARLGSGVGAEAGGSGLRAFERLLTYPPEQAAEEILTGVERRRARVLITRKTKTIDLLVRLLPTSYRRVLQRLTP
ncbi:MAG: SDR family NAD(P)-dependent oxidoreductase [Propionibacteriaceae bacterium]